VRTNLRFYCNDVGLRSIKHIRVVDLKNKTRTNLGCKVVGCTAERPSCEGARFCEPEIGNFDMSIKVEEDVFGFKVTIDNIEGVKMMEG
jgi:hypothetical protein